MQRRYAVALSWVALAAVFPGAGARGDDVRPVSVQVREQESGRFLVQWQVPTVLPADALPRPVLPEGCEAQGERSVVEQPGTWVLRRVFHCPDGIAGRRIGVDFPIVNPSITTLIRLELLSGEQLVHVLQPGEELWQVPAASGGALPPVVRDARRALLRGGEHLFAGGIHLVFLVALGFAGLREGAGAAGPIRLVSGFSSGQLLGAAAAGALGLGLTPFPTELGLAVAVVVMARSLLGPTDRSRATLVVSAAAGVVHGLGLGAVAGPGWIAAVAAVLGMDALLLTGALLLSLVGRRMTLDLGSLPRKTAAYALGGTGMAAALALVLLVPDGKVTAAPRYARLPGLAAEAPGGPAPRSGSVASTVSDAPVQSFLSIEAFEIRHEVLLRPEALAEQLDLEGVAVIETELQPDVASRAAELVAARTALTIDGRPGEPLVDRVDFLTTGGTGMLPRPEPVPERTADAWLGVTVVYTTSRTPDELVLAWDVPPESGAGVPTTVTDPEITRSSTLTPDGSSLTWRNELSEDPIPTLVAVAAEPASVSLPLVSILVLLGGGVGVVGLARSRHRRLAPALGRMLLALALMASPMGRVALAVPGSAGSTPTTEQARRLLAGTLRNVYRALELRDESMAYDRLAISVTGDALSQVYLEHRRAMELEERGGARARVEVVEVPEVRSIEEPPEGGFLAEAVWLVGGTVTHFGHRHFRQNRYDAEVALVAEDGVWKIRAIEILDEERLR